jgi:DNA-binding protein H-NS
MVQCHEFFQPRQKDRYSMSSIDISNLSIAELAALKGSIESIIGSRRESELIRLRETFEDMAAESGFTLEEVMQATPSRKRAAVQAKYRNPDNYGDTWSGRGRKPLWAVALLESGGSLEECLI